MPKLGAGRRLEMVEKMASVEIPADMQLVYERPESLTEAHTHY